MSKKPGGTAKGRSSTQRALQRQASRTAGEGNKAAAALDAVLDQFLTESHAEDVVNLFASLRQLSIEAFQSDKKAGKSDSGVSFLDLHIIQVLTKYVTKFKGQRFLSMLWDRVKGRVERKHRQSLAVVVVGAGPVGLRSAIEAVLSGAKSVEVFERRSDYLRRNCLLLWDQTVDDLSKLGARQAGLTIAGSQFKNVQISELELFLLRVALLLGVDVHYETTYIGFDLPGQAIIEAGARRRRKTRPFDVLIGVEGGASLVRDQAKIKSSTVGYTKEIWGMTANFVPPSNLKGDQEIFESDEIISGAVSKDAPKLKIPGVAKLLHLPNPSTWYMALEPSADKARELRDMDQAARERFAQGIGKQLGVTTPLQQTHRGDGDVALFQVQVTKAEASATILSAGGKINVVSIEGDAAATPYWYLGTGVNKGFLNVTSLGEMLSSLVDLPQLTEKTVQPLVDKKNAAFKANQNVWQGNK